MSGYRAKIRVNSVHVLDACRKAVTQELFAHFLGIRIGGLSIVLDDDDVHGQIAVVHPPTVSLGHCVIRVGGHIERMLILKRRRRVGSTEALFEEPLEIQPFSETSCAAERIAAARPWSGRA